jgi:carbonic anhydrase
MPYTSCVGAAGDVHWGYTGAGAPDHWGELSREFRACSEGKNQSPIDLNGFIEADLPPIDLAYQPGGAEVVNNGHSIQVNYLSGSALSVDDRRFELQQFHFHAPSENHVQGSAFPMEAHLVHADGEGNLAVIAVMFEEGTANAALQEIWAAMPDEPGRKAALPAKKVLAGGILPAQRDYYRFNGSLTTPPCSEGVWWLVMKEPVSVSKAQIEQFEQIMGHPNNRPIQPVNARPILK